MKKVTKKSRKPDRYTHKLACHCTGSVTAAGWPEHRRLSGLHTQHKSIPVLCGLAPTKSAMKVN